MPDQTVVVRDVKSERSRITQLRMSSAPHTAEVCSLIVENTIRYVVLYVHNSSEGKAYSNNLQTFNNMLKD